MFRNTKVKLRSLFRPSKGGRIIFIMGCGRSGTHWLGYILKSHPDIEVTIEHPELFGKVKKMALDPSTKRVLLPKLYKSLQKYARETGCTYYADKSHPSMWIAEDLAAFFPDALFIGIQRNPYAKVASMIEHRGVTKWAKEWRRYPIPNRFLGITHELANSYDGLSIAERHAIRWQAHAERMKELSVLLKGRMLLLSYERLQKNTRDDLFSLAEFLHLEETFEMPEVKTESLEKWRDKLTKHQVREIGRIVSQAAKL